MGFVVRISCHESPSRPHMIKRSDYRGVTHPNQTSHGIAPPTMMPVAACMRYAHTTIFTTAPHAQAHNTA